jgi:predicted SnoaL-like aldol condensation-catalyzing enzyme
MISGALLALAFGSASTGACETTAAGSRSLVERFYTTALIDRNPAEAFSRDVAPEFIEHKPDVATGDRAGATAFLSGLIAELPNARWEIIRVTGDAELVAVHARFVPAKGAPAYAIADFFRVKDCRIVEHWDVVAGPPAKPVNQHSRF